MAYEQVQSVRLVMTSLLSANSVVPLLDVTICMCSYIDEQTHVCISEVSSSI
jgi:hypothetical protein